jgi:hypothetical protein
MRHRSNETVTDDDPQLHNVATDNGTVNGSAVGSYANTPTANVT